MKPYIISVFVNTSKDGQDIMLFYRTNCIDKLQQFEQEILVKAGNKQLSGIHTMSGNNILTPKDLKHEDPYFKNLKLLTLLISTLVPYKGDKIMYKYVLIDLDDSTFKYLKTKQDVIKIAKFMWQDDEITQRYFDGKFTGTFEDALNLLKFNNFDLAELL